MVEVIVSLAIIGLLVVAVLPQLISGIKGNDFALRNTQAKSHAQSELELLRNLPWNVDPTVDTTAGDYIDLFDRYYRNLTPPSTAPTCTDPGNGAVAPNTSNSGYVPGTTGRCSWEPTGPMYRRVVTATQNADLDGFVVVVNTQFLTNTTPPTVVTPPSGYNTQDSVRDNPPSTQIAVTVTVLDTDKGVRVPVSTRTQIAESTPIPPRIISNLDVTALDLRTTTATTDLPATMTAGRMVASGELGYTSTAEAYLSAVAGSVASGARGEGASTHLTTPPVTSAAAVDRSDGSVPSSGCVLICWGGSSIFGFTASAVNALPNIGSPVAPLTALLRNLDAQGHAFQFAAGPGARYRTDLHLTGPLVSSADPAVGSALLADCTVGNSGTTVRAGAGGWLTSTAPDASLNPNRVEVCGGARLTPISVLPTTFAPDGVVRVAVDRLTARCVVSGASHTPSVTYDYSARVLRWTPGGYVNVATVSPSTTTDVLAAVDLSGITVGTYGPLSQWIDSWSSITPARITATATSNTAHVEIPGVINLSTTPTRAQVDSASGDPLLDGDGLPVLEPSAEPSTEPSAVPAPAPIPDLLSTMSITAGTLSCTAKDIR